jgi:hypothetical protein
MHYRTGLVQVVIGGVLLFSFGVAHALLLDAKTDEQKHRKDIASQVSKYTSCLTKAATTCEKKGVDSGVECHLATGVVDYAGDPDHDKSGKATEKFQAAIAKCDSKLNFAKKQKTSSYEAIGCPGDCDNNAANGIQRCADLSSFQAAVKGTTGSAAKAQLGTLAVVVDQRCAIDTGKTTNSTEQDQIDCVGNNAAILSKYAKSVFKCQSKCENDYKDKAGGGGPTDDAICLVDDPSVPSDSPFKACVDAALTKAQKKMTLSPSNASLTLVLVNAAINTATDGLYNKGRGLNETDGTQLCSTCGNNVQEGVEECDGSDLGACGACAADCTCAP